MAHSISSSMKDTENEEENVKNIVNSLAHSIPKTIKHFFPNFKNQLRKIKDYRKKTTYTLSEILMGGISLFIFKEGSRNAFNAERKDKDFATNYEKLFSMSLPHMDTVDDIFRVLDSEELEKFKVKMVQELLEKKVLHKWRFLGRYFIVAIDGTGVMSFSEPHCDKCLVKTYESGKKGYFHNVLEAKLVLPNGLSISLATEWIENDSEDYIKQDSELKAFKRLSEKLKKYFPRLPICIVGDGLYPNEPVFDICKHNSWEYIITLKDGNLPSVWEEVESLLPITTENKVIENTRKSKEEITSKHKWVNRIDYKTHKLNWIKTEETITHLTDGTKTTKKFVYVSSLQIKKENATQVSFSGRMRGKIEDSFNDQKNRGYELKHKYSEVSLIAAKNYYQSLQIASIINQLLVLGQKLKKSNFTIKHIWKHLLSFMLYREVDEDKILNLIRNRIQIRLE